MKKRVEQTGTNVEQTFKPISGPKFDRGVELLRHPPLQRFKCLGLVQMKKGAESTGTDIEKTNEPIFWVRIRQSDMV